MTAAPDTLKSALEANDVEYELDERGRIVTAPLDREQLETLAQDYDHEDRRRAEFARYMATWAELEESLDAD